MSLGVKNAMRQHVNRAFREVKNTPPAVVARTRRSKGPAQARRQSIAIALNKAQRGKTPYAGVKHA